jgi:hypothetical protein
MWNNRPGGVVKWYAIEETGAMGCEIESRQCIRVYKGGSFYNNKCGTNTIKHQKKRKLLEKGQVSTHPKCR